MQEEEGDKEYDSEETESGVQIDSRALLLEMVGTEVLEKGANWPLVPFCELGSSSGDFFILALVDFVLTSLLLLLLLLAALSPLILKPGSLS